MKNPSRLLLALLAVAGSSAVLAQSSVTLYGRVNTTVERQKAGDDTSNQMVNNSSRFGFRGVEDLGGGLKAGFVLESGFASDTGASASTFFGRQSELNLSGNFGMLRLGNFFPESYYATADYVSMHNHDTGTSADALYLDPVWLGTGTATGGRLGGGACSCRHRVQSSPCGPSACWRGVGASSPAALTTTSLTAPEAPHTSSSDCGWMSGAAPASPTTPKNHASTRRARKGVVRRRCMGQIIAAGSGAVSV